MELLNTGYPQVERPYRKVKHQSIEQMQAQFAKNVAMIIQLVCRYPVHELSQTRGNDPWPIPQGKYPRNDVYMLVKRLLYYLKLPPQFAALALIYVTRFVEARARLAPIYLKHITAAFILTSKFHDDYRISLRKWSEVSGIATGALVSAELEVIELLGWDMNISIDAYYRWGKFMHNLLVFCGKNR